MTLKKQIRGKARMLAIDLEPTPYKTDLYNIFADSSDFELFVLYTEQKNWSPDGGHNYLKFPEIKYKHTILKGKGMSGVLYSAFFVLKKILREKTDLIYISGYVHLSTILAIFLSFLLKRNFVVHADEFNNELPKGRPDEFEVELPKGSLSRVKWIIRELLRKLIFNYSAGVLVCGRRGIETAKLAGCDKGKIWNFPYVIDVERIKVDSPENIPQKCLDDKKEDKLIIFFSGRMISRKGLPSLLSALSRQAANTNGWILWIEGDGPELDRYIALAKELGLKECCRFLGFCQYDLHSWLIRSSDIVVVPSLWDTWGIVVDEGIQLGKAVISSDVTGSGYDRIDHGDNGFIFPAGNIEVLAELLSTLVNNTEQRLLIAEKAKSNSKNIRPLDNLNIVLEITNK